MPVNLYKNIITKYFNQMKLGTLTMHLPNGEKLKFGSTQDIIAHIDIHDLVFFKKLVFGVDIALGETYVKNIWTTNSIYNVVTWFVLNLEHTPNMSGSQTKPWYLSLLRALHKCILWYNQNSLSGSKKNIEYHYDLSNQFYKLKLDKTMTYSCAIYKNNNTSLEDAQKTKYEKICQNLQLKPTDHILEIGCGWGGFSEYVARKYQCAVTGITISQEQHKYAQKRIQNIKLNKRVNIVLEDYRKMQGTFDKIVSIEMIEAVGHKYYPIYFKKIHKLLKKDGMFCIQAITCPDVRYHDFKSGLDFIQKHIFPGSLLPSIGYINTIINKVSDFHLYKLEDFGLHYVRTLKAWQINLAKNKKKIMKLGFSKEFFNKWNYYLEYCQAAFFTKNISLVQLTYTRPNNHIF